MLQESTVSNAQEIRKPPRKSENNKAHLSYWKKRIFRPTYSKDGQTHESPNFCVEIQHAGKRVRWSLGPATRIAAADRALKMYDFIRVNGWEAALAKYRPAAARQADPSIGTFIKAVEAVADIEPRTLKGYLGALRKITADIAGLADDKRKVGSGRGHKEWLARVDAVKLSALTPKAVQEWKRSFIARAEPDPVSQRSAR